jgi:hypothetical protein
MVGVIKATPIRPVPPGAAAQTPSDQPHGPPRLSRACSLSLSHCHVGQRRTGCRCLHFYSLNLASLLPPQTDSLSYIPRLACDPTQPNGPNRFPFQQLPFSFFCFHPLCYPSVPCCCLTTYKEETTARSMKWHTRRDAVELENVLRQPSVRLFARCSRRMHVWFCLHEKPSCIKYVALHFFRLNSQLQHILIFFFFFIFIGAAIPRTRCPAPSLRHEEGRCMMESIKTCMVFDNFLIRFTISFK